MLYKVCSGSKGLPRGVPVGMADTESPSVVSVAAKRGKFDKPHMQYYTASSLPELIPLSLWQLDDADSAGHRSREAQWPSSTLHGSPQSSALEELIVLRPVVSWLLEMSYWTPDISRSRTSAPPSNIDACDFTLSQNYNSVDL